MAGRIVPYCERLKLPTPQVEDFTGNANIRLFHLLVSGSAPGWDDPWSRARRVQVLSLGAGAFLVEADGERWEVSRMDIQAVRPASE